MDLSIYFESLDQEKTLGQYVLPNTLGHEVSFHFQDQFPDWENASIAIIGVKEDRNAIHNKGCAQAPDAVRKYLYQLYAPGKLDVVDLGNINAGHTVEDTYFAVSSVITELNKRKVFPIIIGGGQDITYANYLAYERLEQTVNIVSVDRGFDLGDVEDDLDSRSYLSKIILHQPNFLFNYSNIGYQTYFVDPKILDLVAKLFFDAYRLGEIQSNIQLAEPIVRNADVLTFDISAIRQSDAPGNSNATPNGLYGEEACQICRYAGMSDKLSSIGFYELNPLLDNHGQTSHLVAQMIWYVMEGFVNRKKDFPIGDKSGYTKYRVSIKDYDHEIIFYKSNKSERWWMDVPYPPNKRIKFERHHLVPCAYSDYQTACRDEMPDKWWKTFQKLS